MVLEKLTNGEKIALSKGLDLLTDSQAAVCYLYAKDLSHKIFSKATQGYVIPDYVSHSAKLNTADSIGLKDQSFMRAVKKFRIL